VIETTYYWMLLNIALQKHSKEVFNCTALFADGKAFDSDDGRSVVRVPSSIPVNISYQQSNCSFGKVL